MPRLIEIKIPVEYFEKDKNNRLEARLAKFELDRHDIIRFREWDLEKKIFTGRYFDKEVVDFHKIRKATRFWSKKDLLEHGIYVFQLKNARKRKNK